MFLFKNTRNVQGYQKLNTIYFDTKIGQKLFYKIIFAYVLLGFQ